MRSRVDRDGPAVLALLRRGASATEASAATGVNVNTVRSWVRRHEEFGAAARGRPRTPTLSAVEGQAAVPDRQELLELLAEQARNGSVRAIELLMRELPAEGVTDARATARRLMALVPPP
jgi:transposase-like protein